MQKFSSEKLAYYTIFCCCLAVYALFSYLCRIKSLLLMKTKPFVFSLIASALMLGSCGSHYQVSNVSRTRLLVDNRYEATPDARAASIVAPFKQVVDSAMSPVVGTTARYMAPDRPEDLLSNLLPDVLMWGAAKYNEHPDFAVYNIGGIRAAFAKGKVTYGDVIDVAPFENKICFLTLTGEKVLELFQQIALRGGEGLSHGVQLTITKDWKFVDVTLNGEPIDKTRNYRLATLDYLSQGNDGMGAFRSGTDLVSPQDENNNVRYIIMDYFRDKMSRGEEVDAQLEGRVVVR